jgi:N-acetyl-gamma-glutamyl-phosphate reductase
MMIGNIVFMITILFFNFIHGCHRDKVYTGRVIFGNHFIDRSERRRAYDQADLAILCLPDEASQEIVSILGDDHPVRILDASSAFRTNASWVYGLPELHGQAELIRSAKLVTNPGCYATGAISILRPLRDFEIIGANDRPIIHGVSGYTGGGKSMIEAYERANQSNDTSKAFTAYSLASSHKHAAEIAMHSRLNRVPNFMPHVIPVPRGMMVSVSFDPDQLSLAPSKLVEFYRDYYSDNKSKITVRDFDPSRREIDFSVFKDLNSGGRQSHIWDQAELIVTGFNANTHYQIRVTAMLDNLGKGAAGQALQNMRLMLGI